MLTPMQQLDRLRHIEQALDYIVPALRELSDAGHEIAISVNPDAEGGSQHIVFTMFRWTSDRADAANLADLLGWTESSVIPSADGSTDHHQWYGTVKGFKARLVLLLPRPVAVVAPVPVAGVVVQPVSEFAARPAVDEYGFDLDMPPAPQS
jgi:hypothetical protein